MDPETTPLHEALEGLSGALQAGVTVVLLVGLLVSLTLICAHAIREARATTRRQQDRQRRGDVMRRHVHRGEEAYAPRSYR